MPRIPRKKDVNAPLTLPTNEYQGRPLHKLNKTKRKEAWQLALKKSRTSSPSYVEVRKAVKEVFEKHLAPHNSYCVGGLVRIEAKDDPDLVGRSGHLGIVRKVYTFTCDVETRVEELANVKPEHLKLIEEARGQDTKDRIERLIAMRDTYERTSLGSLLLRYYTRRTALDEFDRSVLDFLEERIEELAT